MSTELREEDKRSLRGALTVYQERHRQQMLELQAIDFVIAHVSEEWRKSHPWEHDSGIDEQTGEGNDGR